MNILYFFTDLIIILESFYHNPNIMGLLYGFVTVWQVRASLMLEDKMEETKDGNR